MRALYPDSSHCHQLPLSWVLGPPPDRVSEKRLRDPWVSSPHPGPCPSRATACPPSQALRACSLSIHLSGKEPSPLRRPARALEGGGASWPEQWGGMSLSRMRGCGTSDEDAIAIREHGGRGDGAGGPGAGSGIIGGHSSALFRGQGASHRASVSPPVNGELQEHLPQRVAVLLTPSFLTGAAGIRSHRQGLRIGSSASGSVAWGR